ncbi:hypothetical protein NN3_25520 [Nocardia neocaledoniensis NBRC 108232]|nr:hypothetical protein NN3_25520 [Nocardia neocaledoniensis NBRC 108232]
MPRSSRLARCSKIVPARAGNQFGSVMAKVRPVGHPVTGMWAGKLRASGGQYDRDARRASRKPVEIRCGRATVNSQTLSGEHHHPPMGASPEEGHTL